MNASTADLIDSLDTITRQAHGYVKKLNSGANAHEFIDSQYDQIRKALEPDMATSVEELDNMIPDSAILLSGVVYTLDGDAEGWVNPGLRGVIDSPEIELPVRVLYRAGA